MKKTVNDWLRNPDRPYGIGVSLFEAIASEAYKKKYLYYFQNNCDPEMLVAKILKFSSAISPNAVYAPAVSAVVPTPVPVLFKMDSPPILAPVVPASPPAELLERLKYIRPLQATLHADLQTEPRQYEPAKIVNELLTLEHERKDIWDAIENKTGSDPEPSAAATPDVAEDPAVRTARLRKRMNQLRQNIARNKCSAATMAKYKAELLEIETELNTENDGTQQ